jgi:hypothetical protein
MSSIPEAEVILAIDIGSANTRASLFDIVDGRYRLVATGESNSTIGPPLFDLGEGIRMAMDQVQMITGRRMVDETETIILPTTGYGTGVDLLVASISAGPAIKTILAGLMPGVSMESARRLAASAALTIVGEIAVVDRDRMEEQIDLIVSKRPDLILIVGGTDGGAADPILELVELIKLSIGLIPEGQRPRVVFSGNRSLGAMVTERLSDRAMVSVTANLRPSLDREELALARIRLAETLFEIRSSRITGFGELKQWTAGSLIPTGEAFGRLIRYLSKLYDPDKGVLGVDLGANQVTIAAAFEGASYLSTDSNLGMGYPIAGLLKLDELASIKRWLPMEMSNAQLLDYVHNKAYRFDSIPTTVEELQVEYALARQILRHAMNEARYSWPQGKDSRSALIMPPLEPIVVSGATLVRTPRPAYTALVLLDALEPAGVSTIVVDPYCLAPALGALAGVLPLATVQLMEAGVFVRLGTVVCPVVHRGAGLQIMTYHLEYEDGSPSRSGEVNMGQIVALPLGAGSFGNLTLMPKRRVDVGLGGVGHSATLRVAGGGLGVVIDGRGRPLNLPKDQAHSSELSQRWLWEIGALE